MPYRIFCLDFILILFLGMATAMGLVAAVSMETKWMIFILFMIVAVSIVFIMRQRERFLLYLSVVLTSVFLSFHPIYIETTTFYWPVSGFRITIFEVVFFFLFLSWMVRLVVDKSLKVRFFPRITIPFLTIWCLSLSGIAGVAMPGVIKCTNMWLLLESWLIFLYFANNVRDRRMVVHIVAALLLTGILQSFLGMAQHVTGGGLGLDAFGESKSHSVMMAGTGLVSRVSGTFGHPNSLAGYLEMLVAINLSLFFAPISSRLKWALVPVFVIIVTAMTLTLSRGAWLALGLGGVAVLYLCFLRRGWGRFVSAFLSLGILLTFMVGSIAVVEPLQRRMFEEDYGAARARIPMIEVALNIIEHNPLLGIGLGNYTFAAPQYDTSKEGISYDFPRPVHNEFLLIAAELGIPSLILFLGILIYIFARLYRISRSRSDPILAYIGIGLFATYLGWCVFRQTDYTYSLLGDPFWLLAGLSMAIDRILEAPEERSVREVAVPSPQTDPGFPDRDGRPGPSHRVTDPTVGSRL